MLRQGEMVLNSYTGVSGFYNLSPILTKLKNKDFKRTLAFVNGFQRLEVRLNLLIQLIDPTASENKTGGAPTTRSGS
jgi:hypothetical protein